MALQIKESLFFVIDRSCPVCDGFVRETAHYHPAAHPIHPNDTVGSYKRSCNKVRNDVCNACDDKLRDLALSNHWIFGRKYV